MSGNWKWFAPALALLIVLMAFLFGFGILSLAQSMIKNSAPGKRGLAAAMSDSEAVKALGAPVKQGWFVSGSINTSPTSGAADLAIPVRGSTRQGTVYVVAKKSEGEWEYEKIVLKIDGESTRIDLLHHSTIPLENK